MKLRVKLTLLIRNLYNSNHISLNNKLMKFKIKFKKMN